MQEITLYAVVDYTRTFLRNQWNEHARRDPVSLIIGCSVQLNLVLFADKDGGDAPFHLPSGIESWTFCVDLDYDRTTEPMIRADNDNIRAVTSTTQTRIEIPIKNMLRPRLVAALGDQGRLGGLTGELVGYDGEGDTMFCLQINDLEVLNRIAPFTEQELQNGESEDQT